MTIIELTKILKKFSSEYGKRVFRLKELSVFANESQSSACMALIRAAKAGLVSRVGTVWVNSLDPPALEEIAFELRPVSYVSFESILYNRGVLSQSPRGGLSLATTGRSANVQTPFGNIIFVHITKPLFFGFDEKREASAEKAFLDMIYIRIRKGTFDELTEVLYPEMLDKSMLGKLARRFPKYVQKGLLKISPHPLLGSSK